MRVLVTRPAAEAAHTAAALAARGHQALVAPLTEPVRLARPMPEGPFAAVTVTSARAARLLDGEALARLARRPAFAVGARTAAALRARGFADVRVADGDVGALAGLLAAAGLPRGARVLHPGGEERAGDLAGPLLPHGVSVVSWTLYRMRPAKELPQPLAHALAAGTLDAALHYSPGSARTFLALAGAAGRQAEAGKLFHACLSAAVAAPIAAAGLGRIGIAARPEEEALLDVLDH